MAAGVDPPPRSHPTFRRPSTRRSSRVAGGSAVAGDVCCSVIHVCEGLADLAPCVPGPTPSPGGCGRCRRNSSTPRSPECIRVHQGASCPVPRGRGRVGRDRGRHGGHQRAPPAPATGWPAAASSSSVTSAGCAATPTAHARRTLRPATRGRIPSRARPRCSSPASRPKLVAHLVGKDHQTLARWAGGPRGHPSPGRARRRPHAPR